jgi:hypothetical protein
VRGVWHGGSTNVSPEEGTLKKMQARAPRGDGIERSGWGEGRQAAERRSREEDDEEGKGGMRIGSK